MTTNEAIDIIQTIKDVGYFTNEGNEAFDKALEVLKKETMCDEILNDVVKGEWITKYDSYFNWINGGYIKVCSKCGELPGSQEQLTPYCPNCGAKMRK